MTLSCSKKLSTLLHTVTSENNGDFYCLNFIHSFRTKNKLKSHEKIYKKIYADITSLILRIDGCANNPEISSATK